MGTTRKLLPIYVCRSVKGRGVEREKGGGEHEREGGEASERGVRGK